MDIMALLDTLITVLTLAFFAWAGVVWRSAEAVRAGLAALTSRLGVLEQRLVEIEKDLDWLRRARNG